jgi:hypothetical protein
MPTETLVWLGVNVVVGLLTLFVALYVTRRPEIPDGPPGTTEHDDGAAGVDQQDAGQN